MPRVQRDQDEWFGNEEEEEDDYNNQPKNYYNNGQQDVNEFYWILIYIYPQV